MKRVMCYKERLTKAQLVVLVTSILLIEGKLLLLSILTLAVVVMLSTTPVWATGNVSITRTFNVAADGYMHEGMLTGNHGDCTSGPWRQLKIESQQGGDPARALLRFDLSPSIPTGSTVSSAILSLFYTADASGDPGGQTYYVNRITSIDWVEGSKCHSTETGAFDWTYRQNDTLAWGSLGGDYTSSGEVSATVPSTPDQWMDWTVTAQVQTAINNGTAAHFIVRDPDTTRTVAATFSSREVEPDTRAKLSITFTAPWDSHTDSARADPAEDTFASPNTTVYMKGTGFASGTYTVSYYDATTAGGGSKVDTDSGITVAGDGILNGQIILTGYPSSKAGTWHALVQPTGATTFPSTYDVAVAAPDTYDLIANDSFTAEQSAIPEFPTALAAIMALALSAGVYFWMRRKVAPVPHT